MLRTKIPALEISSRFDPPSPLCGLLTPLAPRHAEHGGEGDGDSDDAEDETHLEFDALLRNLLYEEDRTVVELCQNFLDQGTGGIGHLRLPPDS